MRILKKIETLLFPKKCPLCSQIIPFGETSCKNCQDKNGIFIPDDLCSRCNKSISNCICTKEEIAEIPYLTSVYYYGDGNVRKSLIEFKFRGNKSHAEFFGNKLAERIAIKFPTVDFDLVTFAPMSKKSLRQRGYNQSELLAKVVAKRLFIPCRNTIVKTKETLSQHDLDFSGRQTNLVGSMVADKNTDIKGKTVLLVDDIKTTGATLRECVKTLKANGAKEVYCITVALVYIDDDLFT